MFTYDLILTAGGSSSRTKTESNKVFLNYKNISLIENAYLLFKNDSNCINIFITTNVDDLKKMSSLTKGFPKVKLIIGGDTRFESIKNAIKHCTSAYTVIHDASRCYLQKEVLSLFLEKLFSLDNLVLAKKMIDCLKKVKNEETWTLKRENYIQSETPQGFRTAALSFAYENIVPDNYYDSSQVIELYYKNEHRINFLFHDSVNKKITLPQDVRELKINKI